MKIGQLAKASGLAAVTIRFYEAEGLLPDPGRDESGYRLYSAEDLSRLDFIRKAKRVGLSLREIRDVLQLHVRGEATCLHVRSLLDGKLVQVDKALEDMKAFRRELVRLKEQAGNIVDCRPLGGRICGIIEGVRQGFGGKPVEVEWT